MTNNKPRLPITVYALALVCLAGLIALFLAANEAFGTVAGPGVRGQTQAIAAALLIEAGLVVESIAVARSRNKLAVIGLALSFLVSASYNYTQASDRRPDLQGWQLLALAIGPLSALTFLSLALGDEIRRYNEMIRVWADEIVAYQRKEDALARRRQERHERRADRPGAEQAKRSTGQVTGQATREGAPARSRPVVRWADRSEYIEAARAEPDLLELTGHEIARIAGKKSPKTGRRWKAKAREAINNGRG